MQLSNHHVIYLKLSYILYLNLQKELTYFQIKFSTSVIIVCVCVCVSAGGGVWNRERYIAGSNKENRLVHAQKT